MPKRVSANEFTSNFLATYHFSDSGDQASPPQLVLPNEKPKTKLNPLKSKGDNL